MTRLLMSLALLLTTCTRPQSEAPVLEDLSWRWTPAASVPTPRTEVTGAAIGDQIYVAGGFTQDGSASAVVEVFDVSAERWSTAPALPVAMDHPMSAASSGRLFIFGGNVGGRPSSAVFEMADGDGWRQVSDMPEPRSAGGAATLKDGRILVAGGVGSSGLSSSSVIFDPDAGRWETLPGLLTPREHLAVASSGGKIYAIGGRNPSNVAATEYFSVPEGRWMEVASMPTARGGLAAAETDDASIVAVGGEDPNKTFDETEVLDTRTNRWSRLDRMPTPRHGLAAVSVEGRLYAICGGTSPGLAVSGIVEVLTRG